MLLVLLITLYFHYNKWGCMSLKIIFICLYITPSHYHHCANLPIDIELIKCLSDIFAECVSEIK